MRDCYELLCGIGVDTEQPTMGTLGRPKPTRIEIVQRLKDNAEKMHE